VAFPAISTGVYRWPPASAAEIAMAAVREPVGSVRVVRFVLFGAEAHRAFASRR
jgi:O-acetyl-ADP-ribose deacetylase (regulator of RNase III)